MSPSRPFILRPVATTLLMVGVLLAGFVAYRQLPVSALPQVDYPTIQVLTFYPGARDRKSTRLNSSHLVISYAVFCLKKKKITTARRCRSPGGARPRVAGLAGSSAGGGGHQPRAVGCDGLRDPGPAGRRLVR